MNLGDELHKLQQLHQTGALSDEEFAKAKARLLDEPPPVSGFDSASSMPRAADPAYIEQQTRQWGMILHLSIFAGYVVPLAGLVVPVVIWQLKKSELSGIDRHGKNAVNWIISHIIYFFGCLGLAFILIGIPLLIALGVLSIVFPIVAAIKANNGQVWKYPLSIPFFN